MGACSMGEPEPSDPASVAIAKVGERTVSKADFEAYLLDAMGDLEEARAADSVLKSRLLDQLIDEEMLVAAAAEQGITVTEEEARRQVPGQTGPVERLKRSLLQKRFKEDVILGGMEVSDEEIEQYFTDHIDEFRRPASAVLRMVLLDTGSEARSVRAELARDPERFSEIAETRSLAPDGGRPQALVEETLPEAIRAAVAGLQEGELSQVVEDPQGFFIIRLEQRRPEHVPDPEEVRDQIALTLMREKSEQRYTEYLEGLRRRTKVEIIQSNLDFPYEREDSST